MLASIRNFCIAATLFAAYAGLGATTLGLAISAQDDHFREALMELLTSGMMMWILVSALSHTQYSFGFGAFAGIIGGDYLTKIIIMRHGETMAINAPWSIPMITMVVAAAIAFTWHMENHTFKMRWFPNHPLYISH